MRRPIVILAVCLLFSTALQASELARKIEFNRDIRPILSDNCFLCHGPDKNTRKAKMRLDVREDAIAKEAFIPGKADASELVKRLFSKDPEQVMPPPETKKILSDAQRATLKEWIAQGAPYEAHWAYTALKRPGVPEVQYKNWVHNPIDAFVLKPLEAKGTKPSGEADKCMLLRRLSLDLVGLPPTPDELKTFLDDSSANAYEKQVDRLLASPHYGERMAVWWLDVARFTDTVGYHGDQNQRIFPYRDYVIDSFNKSKPFDTFTIEQLAGDLLPNPTAEQRVATGFNRLNMMTREGGAQPKEYMAKYGADRVRTVAGAWLGSTMGCCECHDHKFDPFSTKDFYSMKAFFADMKQWGVYSDYGYTPNPDLKGWSNEHPFPPEIVVDSPYLKHRIERLRAKLGDACVGKTLDKTQTDALEKWRAAAVAFLGKNPDGWVAPHVSTEDTTQKIVPPKKGKAVDKKSGDAAAKKPVPEKKPADEEEKKNDDAAAAPPVNDKEKEIEKPAEHANAAVTQNPDGSLIFNGKATKGAEEKLKISPPAGWIAAIRVELLPNEKFDGKFTRDNADGTAIALSASVKSKKDGKETKLAFNHAEADKKDEKYSSGEAVLGVLGGWKTDSKDPKAKQTAIWLLEKPFEAVEGDTLIVALKSDNVGSVRVSVSPFGFERPQDVATDEFKKTLSEPLEKHDAAGRGALLAAYTLGTVGDAALAERLRAIRKEIYECRDAKAHTLVTESKEPIETRVLTRGNFLDDAGAVVEPAVPHFLPQPAVTEKRRLTRLDLAHWLVSPENPLTGRAVMNRLWKQFFGNGLSMVVDDLGAQGEWPTHSELLDWLAVDFREGGWDFKRAIKQIVMSNTYRQDSNLRGELREWDPLNRYLSSQNPRRLDAEFVRDNALSIAGLLNLDIGGPSVKPYQPPNYYANLQFPNRDYVPNTDEREYRRGVYVHWQRTFLHPMLANFDAPMRDECTCTRTVSNTPQQALTLLNDPEFFEAARVFAQRVLMSGTPNATDADHIGRAFQLALARPAKPKEVESLKKFLDEQRKYFKANPADAEKVLKTGLAPIEKSVAADELAAWSAVGRVVLNLHETITKY